MYCYVLRPFGLSLDFAPYENSEAVHPETRVPVSTRVSPKYLDHGKKVDSSRGQCIQGPVLYLGPFLIID